MTGAQALIKSLEMQGVDVMFGLPGGAILPVYDPIIDSSIRHILVRHEQGAGHMAEGYAMATGRPGVAMVTSGPGATNIVTPLANAYMDSTPLIVVSGQVATGSIGTDAFQECDITGVTMGITKHNWLIKDVDDIPRVVAAAFHVATTGRPGPVLIDLPKDISNAQMEWYWPSSVDELDLPGYHPVTFGDPVLIGQAAELISQVAASRALRGRRRAEGPGRRGAAGAGRADRDPRRHDADGPGRLPRLAPPRARHARHARPLHRRHRHAAERPPDQPRRTVRRPCHRQDQCLRPRRQDHPRRHRPRRAGQGARARRRHRRRLPPGHRRAACWPWTPRGTGRWCRTSLPGGSRSTSGGRASPCTTRTSRVVRSSRRTWSSSSEMRRRSTPWSSPAWASTRCGPRSTGSSSSPTPG